MARERLRRGWRALASLAGRSRGFFIPYRYVDDVEPPTAYTALVPYFEQAEPVFRERLAATGAYLSRLSGFVHSAPPAPRLDQDWFPRLDAVLAYTLVREVRPRRIVEIGSGHSTRFLARAVLDSQLGTQLLAIDPAPRATLDGLPIEVARTTVQRVGTDPFAALAAGDILFVDSSHILMPGTDVDFVLNTVLPRLPAGVHIHVHDIFLPDGYPNDWAWRGYNEQNTIAALLATGGFRLLWASHYVATRLSHHVAAAGLDHLPLVAGAHESSLWLTKLG